jgi:hypothetical protein
VRTGVVVGASWTAVSGIDAVPVPARLCVDHGVVGRHDGVSCPKPHDRREVR